MKNILLILMFAFLSSSSFAQVVIAGDTTSIGAQSGNSNSVIYGKTHLKNTSAGSRTDSMLVGAADGVIKFIPTSLFGSSSTAFIISYLKSLPGYAPGRVLRSDFTWVEKAGAMDEILTGTQFFSGAPYSAGREADKAFDSNLTTFYDSSSPSGSYVGIELATARGATRIMYAPRFEREYRMPGGQFQGSNTSSSSGFTTLHTISVQPVYGGYTEVIITDNTPYKWYRYLGPNNGHCNIAEFQIYSPVP